MSARIAILYETPAWVTLALIPHIPKRIKNIYEPAAGSGKIVRALSESGYLIERDDILEGRDFLRHPKGVYKDAIITNPPYALAQEFIEHAHSSDLLKWFCGNVAANRF